MTPEQYRAFTDWLLAQAKADRRVLGLVALGSMAAQDVQPDQWSDHDFFLIVEPGAQEQFRRQQHWLPQADHIVLHFRDTPHGVKVIYGDGHLLEFAVFDPAELAVARFNRYRLLLDRAGLADRLVTMADGAGPAPAAAPDEDRRHWGEFLTNLLVGVGRHQRGEQLNAHQFVRMYALSHLLTLLSRRRPATDADLLDNFNPTRRFERVYPQLGAALNAHLCQEVPAVARDLLALARRELAGQWPADMLATADVVAAAIERALPPEPPGASL